MVGDIWGCTRVALLIYWTLVISTVDKVHMGNVDGQQRQKQPEDDEDPGLLCRGELNEDRNGLLTLGERA